MVTLRPTRTPLARSRPEDLALSESIPLNYGHDGKRPLDAAAIGCMFASGDAFSAAAERLIAAGVAPDAIHVGAASQERADELGRRTGAKADISAGDPLAGIAGYAEEAAARRAVDRAGVWGAAAGAVVGAIAARTPLAHVFPVQPALQGLACVLFCFVLGLFVGSILGAALAPQRSTHVAFRLIDGMSDGGIALIVAVPGAHAAELTRLLEDAGGTDLTHL
jgi:hypothetical protein